MNAAVTEHLRDGLAQSRLGDRHGLMLRRVQVDLRAVPYASVSEKRLHKERGFVWSRWAEVPEDGVRRACESRSSLRIHSPG